VATRRNAERAVYGCLSGYARYSIILLGRWYRKTAVHASTVCLGRLFNRETDMGNMDRTFAKADQPEGRTYEDDI
jgi:hypothetical protein